MNSMPCVWWGKMMLIPLLTSRSRNSKKRMMRYLRRRILFILPIRPWNLRMRNWNTPSLSWKVRFRCTRMIGLRRTTNNDWLCSPINCQKGWVMIRVRLRGLKGKIGTCFSGKRRLSFTGLLTIMRSITPTCKGITNAWRRGLRNWRIS